jgi:hypothetical protein
MEKTNKTDEKEVQEEKTTTIIRKHPVTKEPMEYEKVLVTRKVRKKLDKSQKEYFKTIMEIDQVLQDLNNEMLRVDVYNPTDIEILMREKVGLKLKKAELYARLKSETYLDKTARRQNLVSKLKDMVLTPLTATTSSKEKENLNLAKSTK